MPRVRTFAFVAAVAAMTAGCHSTPQEHGKANLTSAAVTKLAPHAGEKLAVLDKPFEGEIQLDVTEGATKVRALTYDIKGTDLRYSESAAASKAEPRAIANLEKQKAYAVFDDKKSYVELDEAAQGRPAAGVEVHKTGKMETVAGHSCEDWRLKSEGRDVEACVARDVPYFDLTSPATKAKAEPPWAAELEKDRAFPLRVVEKDASGKVAVTAEAKRVEEKTLDESLFRVPPDYRRIDLPKNGALPGIP